MVNTPRVILLLPAERGMERGLLRGIARYSNQFGPWNFYRRPPSYLSPRFQLDLPALRAWKPTGAIGPVELAEELTPLGIPIIYTNADSYLGPSPSIISQHRKAGTLGARHLLELGHRHFAYCGYQRMGWSEERNKAFSQTITEAGFSTHSYRGGGGKKMSVTKEEEDIKNWLGTLPRPIGMLCANDDRAELILEASRVLGLSIPEDFSLVGIDDDEYICHLQNPPLSSVGIASEQAGYRAAALLEKLMSGEQEMEGQKIIAEATRVNVRQSSSALMVDDPELRRALQFIREHADKNIMVSDVVEATKLSHRSLNARFTAQFGCSILKRLSKARVDKICRLLSDTDIKIQEIAAQVGFQDDHHISRFFKRATGLTPLSYRQQFARNIV